jgi:putative methyltransferase (TIGR04325 family)
MRVIRHYCSYFDHNYLPRALLLIDSLRAQGAAFHVHALCLSELCATIMTELALPDVSIIELATFERHYPELHGVKSERTPLEYIFTMTPFLPSYCLETTEGLDEITYLDSDLYFYDDPELVFAEIGDRSIGIIPHRFSANRADHRPFGEFNVGWVTFRMTPEGRRCLTEYRRNCLDWCSERPDNGRFADQGYLNSWPQDYAGVAVIGHKGANVANYNVDNYAVSEHDGRFWCDDQPLIFYHFHAVYLQPEGTYFIDYPGEHFARDAVVIRRLYRPYLARLIQTTHRLRARFPSMDKVPRLQRKGFEIHAAPFAGWSDDRVARARAARALENREPRAGGPPDNSAERLADFAGVLMRAAGTSGRLSVLDWGGGYGDYATAARRLFPDLELDWHIVELKPVCDYGAVLFPDVTFHDDDTAVGARRFDVVLAIASLHFVPDWRGLLDRLAAVTRQFLVLTDLPTAAGAERFTLTERPLDYLPDAVCLSGLVDDVELFARLTTAGLVLERDLRPWSGPPLAFGPLQVTYRHLLFSRPNQGGTV